MSTRRALLVLVALAVFQGLSSGARAGSCTNGPSCVMVSYDITGNAVFDGSTIGSITGSAVWEYPADAVGQVQAGPVHVVSIMETLVINFATGPVQVTGTAQITGVPSQSGTLLNPGGVQPNGQLLLNLSGMSAGFLHCFGSASACAYGGLPLSTPVPYSGVGTTVLSLLGTPSNPVSSALFNIQHTLTFTSTSITPSGTSITTTVFTEVARTFMPEPSGSVLSGMALLTLVIIGGFQARRHRRL